MAISQYLIGLNKCYFLKSFLTHLGSFFVKTSVNLFVFFLSSPLIFFKCFLLFSVITQFVRLALVQTLLYFEHWVFLELDDVFCYNKDTQRNENEVISWKNLVFCFSHLSKQYNIGRISSISI